MSKQIPFLQVIKDYPCPKCGTKSEVVVQGIQERKRIEIIGVIGVKCPNHRILAKKNTLQSPNMRLNFKVV